MRKRSDEWANATKNAGGPLTRCYCYRLLGKLKREINGLPVLRRQEGKWLARCQAWFNDIHISPLEKEKTSNIWLKDLKRGVR